MSTNLSQLVTHLAVTRAQLEVEKKEISPEITRLKELIIRIEKFSILLSKEVRNLEDQVRNEVVAQHIKTGETKYDGVTVKHFKVVTITDDRLAKVWASINIPELLTLGSGFGNKVNGLDLPFYNVDNVYRAQIDSDLSRFIDDN